MTTLYQGTAGSTCFSKLAAILVFGQHDASFMNRKINHGFILSPQGHLRSSHNIVAIGAKDANYREVTAFIGQEAHRLSR